MIDQEMDKRMSNLKIIWFSMLVASAIYLFVGLFLGQRLEKITHVQIDKDTFSTIKVVLYILSFLTLFSTRYIRKLILSGKILV